MTIILEKSKEVEKLTQELTALQKKHPRPMEFGILIVEGLGGWQCRECKRVLPLIRVDEARVPPLQAKVKSAQDSLSFLQSRANATSQSLSKAPPSKNLSSQKVLKSIESLQGFLKKLI